MNKMMVRRYRTWCLSMAVALLGLAFGRGETAVNQQDEEIRWKAADIEEILVVFAPAFGSAGAESGR